MALKAFVPFLVAMMLLTGCCNTLLTKYQDNQCVRNCEDPNPQNRQHFEQPVIQTAQMFIGEMGCWLVVALLSLSSRYTARRRDVNGVDYHIIRPSDGGIRDTDSESLRSESPLNAATSENVLVEDDDERLHLQGRNLSMLALPAICDICGTTLMNVGLLFVVPSVYQMTRGMLVIWVGIFSVLFLNKRLHLYQWFALTTVVLGVSLVGLAGAMFSSVGSETSPALAMTRSTVMAVAREAKKPETLQTIVGVLLIAGAQIFTATQFVLEEFILEKYALEPLKVVGWEGIFGFLVTFAGMILLHLTIGRTTSGRYGYFDAVEGWREITTYRSIGISSLLIMISIGGFNFFGLSVTRTVSATSRSTIDTCRTLFIWIISLGLGWETFKWLQVVGFGLLVYGTFLFNGIVQPPLRRCVVSHVEALLPQEPIEHM